MVEDVTEVKILSLHHDINTETSMSTKITGDKLGTDGNGTDPIRQDDSAEWRLGLER